MTATNREGIYEATLQAAHSIAGESSAIRVLVAEEALEDFTVVAAEGGTEEVVGRTISLSTLRDWKRDRLRSHRSYEVPIARGRARRAARAPRRRVTFLLNGPLFMKDELRGLLVVGEHVAPSEGEPRHAGGPDLAGRARAR